MDFPWWAYSPSPFTLAFWGAMGLFGAYKLGGLKQGWRQFAGSLADSAWLLGIVVLGFDAAWCVGQMKFFPLNLVLVFAIGRDLFGALLCYMMIVRSSNFKKFEKMKAKVEYTEGILILALTLYMLIWFYLAPDPSFTDWTYAIRLNYSWSRVWEAFLISHVGAKSLQGLIYWSLWR